MRRLFKMAMAASTGLVLAMPWALPARATPGPYHEEWWFDSWSIQSKIWPKTKGKGVTVAVIDTGVNGTLPEIKNALLPGLSVLPDGGDGWEDSDPEGDGHGTAMAYLIAGQGGGPTGFVGVAPDAKVLPISDGGNIIDPTFATAIRFGADHGAKVISISQGAHAGYILNGSTEPDALCPPLIQDAITYARQRDVIVVAAAGNSGAGDVEYPASCPGVLAVGAYDHLGNAWESSAHTPFVDVGGPGVRVSSVGRDGRIYHYGSGTSHATALTSGAVALIRSRFPHESARQILQRIFATLTDVGPEGKDDQIGYGGININKALNATNIPRDAPDPVDERFDQALKDQATSMPTADPARDAAAKTGASGWPAALVVGAGAIVAVLLVVVVLMGILLPRHARRRRARHGTGATPFASRGWPGQQTLPYRPAAQQAPRSAALGQQTPAPQPGHPFPGPSPHQGPPPAAGPPPW